MLNKVSCDLCDKKEKFKEIIYKNKTAISIICKWPLKDSHILIFPIRHIEKLSDFSKDEAKDFLDMCEKMQYVSKKNCEDLEEPFVFKNFGKNITQNHIHFHIVPSKGGLRELVSNFDKVEYRKEVSNEEMEKLAEKLRKSLKF